MGFSPSRFVGRRAKAHPTTCQSYFFALPKKSIAGAFHESFSRGRLGGGLLGDVVCGDGGLRGRVAGQSGFGPLRRAPTIDGVIDPQEWKGAEPVTFELTMLQLKGGAVSKRACQLWMMNSANALYLALRVPDATVNNCIVPIDLDMAIIAFCRGKEVAHGRRPQSACRRTLHRQARSLAGQGR